MINIVNEIIKRKNNLAYKSISDWMHLDYPLLISTLILQFFGLILIYSASQQNIIYTSKQVFHIIMGIFIIISIAQIDLNKLCRYSPKIFIFSILLLIFTFFFGITINGAKRWINLYFFRLQPSELTKFALPMFLAWYFNKEPFPILSRQIILGFAATLIPFLLIAKQPDLATAIMILLSGLLVMFISLTPWKFFIFLIISALVSSKFLWNSLHVYQKNRINTLLDPSADPLGTGYHIIQSKIAIGSGGLSGMGWMQGMQSNLKFLPENTTDFVFSVCAEEFGFMGCIFVLLLYFYIFLRTLIITSQSSNYYGQLLCYSLISIFLLSAFINIGMVSGIFPVVGIPLPFLSYGGTSMMTNCAIIGIILACKSSKIN